jgi:hypothetical protein
VTLPDGGVQSANLLLNGDAEAATGASAPNLLVDIPSWTRAASSPFNVLQYAFGGDFPVATTPGSPSRGANFFYGGEGSADERITQRIAVPGDWLARVDAASTQVVVSGWFGGFAGQADTARLKLTFLSDAGVSLGTTQVGDVSPIDRGAVTALLQRSTSIALPPNTRTIEAALECTHDEGGSNDGYADDLVVVLQGPPPPSAANNLLVNGGAEAGPASLDGLTPVATLPGWTRAVGSGFSVLSYANTLSGFPVNSTPGSPSRGLHYFFGGNAGVTASVSQVVVLDVALQARIDASQASWAASGWFGGYLDQNDRAALTLEFLSAADAVLGTEVIGGVTDTDRADLTSMLQRSSSGVLPANTRKIRATLTSTHDEGDAVDGYADDLVLTVQ